MIEMAIVGLGSWGLCVLERTVSRARQAGTPVRVHVVEPARLGGGAYAPEQPDFLVLNNACGQLSLYAAPDGDALPPYAVGVYQWAVACGYRWVGYECRIGAGGDPILPTDYLPRRLMGEYLGWFYNTLLDYAPPNLEIVRHYAAAVDISPALQGREAVLLDNGTTLTVDHVVLTSGHTWNDEPGAGGGVHYLQPYPIECLEQSAPAGSSLAVAGMGLVCYDVLTALTIGRGGTFEDRCDRADRKRYVPSGREPTITLYSRSGVPHCAKSAQGVDPYAVAALDSADQTARAHREADAARNYTRGRIGALLGVITESTGGSLERLRRDLDTANERVAQLLSELNPDEDREQLLSRLNIIGRTMTDLARRLELEHVECGVRLDLANLTVVTDTSDGPLPLQRIGSAANWIGYHLATHLGLHQFFVENDRPVPRFLMIDQPTQAFYPSDTAKNEGTVDDADRAAVLAMFTVMRDVVEVLAPRMQIIVSDHADLVDEAWFQDAVRHRWRGGIRLIPTEWLEDENDEAPSSADEG